MYAVYRPNICLCSECVVSQITPTALDKETDISNHRYVVFCTSLLFLFFRVFVMPSLFQALKHASDFGLLLNFISSETLSLYWHNPFANGISTLPGYSCYFNAYLHEIGLYNWK
jgi:hypothetical protein